MKKLLVTSVALAALVVPASTGASASGFKIDDIPGYIFVHRPDVGLTVCVPGDGEQIETVGAAVLDAETGQIAFRAATLNTARQVAIVEHEHMIKTADGTTLALDARALVTALVDIGAITKKHPFAEADIATDLLTIDPRTMIGIVDEKLLVATDVPDLPVPDMPKMAHVESPVPA